MIPIELFFISILLAAIAGFLIGWDQAVHNHRAARRAAEQHATTVQQGLDRFNEQAAEDPQRAWIDIGIRSTLARLDHFLRRERDI